MLSHSLKNEKPGKFARLLHCGCWASGRVICRRGLGLSHRIANEGLLVHPDDKFAICQLFHHDSLH